MSNTPSKAEIEKLAAEHLKAFSQFPMGGQVWFEGKVEFARAALARWGSPQPVVREPLTREQVKAIMAEAGYDREAPQPRADFISGLRHGERAHGITQKGGS